MIAVAFWYIAFHEGPRILSVARFKPQELRSDGLA
jgi:hypothetical protein